MPATLEEQLNTLQVELKSYFDKAAEEKKSQGGIFETTKIAIEALQKQVDAIDSKLAEKLTASDGQPPVSIEKQLKENEQVQRLMRDRSGRAVITVEGKSAAALFERKTTITGPIVGYETTGVLQIDRTPGITTEARRTLVVRDLLSARPTAYPIVDFVKVSSPMTIASPVAENTNKPENAVTFAAVSERVKTIATWIPATRQILDDFTELAGFIQTSLPYYVNLAEEQQLLSGDGTGENLHGLIPQATTFNTGLLNNTAGWTRIDVIGRAIQQITASAELQPTFVVLHPNDWWAVRLTKDGFGRYILGDPQVVGRPNIFGLDMVETPTMAAGTFLVGSGSAVASEIRDRMQMQVEISTEHASFFVQNLVAIRGEKRLALVVKRPGSYITGNLTSSPVS
jgi:HK97 family phage major capsid protein